VADLGNACPYCNTGHPLNDRFCPTTGRQLPARQLGPGDVLEGRYEIVRPLGAGAMGVVFEARHRELGKRVAVKAMRTDVAGDADLIARFRQEAQAASAIGHPNIVEVFDLGTAAGSLFMVMELLPGQSLAELLAREPLLTPERAGRISAQVLSALAAAHRQGIVHRDLKPDNIFLVKREDDAEFVKLLDFGIAKILAAADERRVPAGQTPKPTQYGIVMGTPQYMAPEQARGLPGIDHRVDLWATGCVLYEALCGRTPFEGDTYNQILGAIIDGYFPRPSDLRPAVGPALEGVLLKALAHRREHRYESADAMRDDLLVALSALATPPAIAAPLRRVRSAGGGASGNAALGTLGPLAPADSFSMPAQLDAVDLTNATGAASPAAPAPPTHAPQVRTPTPAVRATPVPAGRATPSRPIPALAAPDAFRPPDADEQVDLDVAVVRPDHPRLRTSPRASVSASARMTIARPRQRSSGILRGFLVLIILGVAGGAAYRYYRLGYLWRAPEPEAIELAIDVSPVDAEMYVNQELFVQRPLTIDPDREYEIEFRAKGRLTARRQISARRGALAPLSVRLSHRISPVPRATAPVDLAGLDTGAAAPGQIDEAFKKLDLYRACLDLVADSIQQSHAAYSVSLPRGPPKKGRIPDVIPLSQPALSECRVRVGQARDLQPALAGLDEAARVYLETLGELVPKTGDAASYYQKAGYERDDFKYGRKLHEDLPALYERAVRDQLGFATTLAGEEVIWQEMELRVTPADSAMWHVRNVALRADAWLRALVRDADPRDVETAREAFIATARQTDDYVSAHAEEVKTVIGAEAYLRGIAPLRELAKKLKLAGGEREEALSWHSRSVKVFNEIVLTR
jgi:serine/threonine protein kinase